MSIVFINPGAGPIEGGHKAKAERDIHRWAKEQARRTGGQIVFVHETNGGLPSDGRWSFNVGIRIKGKVRKFEVDIPGVDNIEAGPWAAPRLYVDGNSWLWEYSFNEEEDFE